MTQASNNTSLQLEAEGVLVKRAKVFLESDLDASSMRQKKNKKQKNLEIPCHKVKYDWKTFSLEKYLSTLWSLNKFNLVKPPVKNIVFMNNINSNVYDRQNYWFQLFTPL